MNEKLQKQWTVLKSMLQTLQPAANFSSPGLPGLYLLVGQAEAGKSTKLANIAAAHSEQFRDDLSKGVLSLDTSYEWEDQGVACSFIMGGEPEYKASFPWLMERFNNCSSDIIILDSIRMLALFKPKGADTSDFGDYSIAGQIFPGGTTAQLVVQLDQMNRKLLQAGQYCVAVFNPLLSDSAGLRTLLNGSAVGIISLDGLSVTSYRTDDAEQRRAGAAGVQSFAAESWFKEVTDDSADEE